MQLRIVSPPKPPPAPALAPCLLRALMALRGEIGAVADELIRILRQAGIVPGRPGARR